MEKELFILWTNDNVITTKNMVCMYSVNSIKRKWWDAVTVIVWGATVKLLAEDESIQKEIKRIISEGVHVSVCRACSEELGVLNKLEDLGFELRYMGDPLTQILKNNSKLLTI